VLHHHREEGVGDERYHAEGLAAQVREVRLEVRDVVLLGNADNGPADAWPRRSR
jgi:hypothetical protein